MVVMRVLGRSPRRLAAAVLIAVLFGWSPVMSTVDPVNAALPTSSFVVIPPIRAINAAGSARLLAGNVQYMTVAGRHGVPTNATAVVVDVTLDGAGASTRVWANPSGGAFSLLPVATVRPFARATQSATLKIGGNGKIEFRADSAVDLYVDVLGYYVPASSSRSGRYVATTPSVLADRRQAAGGRLVVDLPASVPSGVSAVVLDLTAHGSATNGWWKFGSTVGAYVVPANVGAIAFNQVVLPVSSRSLSFVNDVEGQLRVDLVGWYTDGSAPSSADGLFVPVDRSLMLDTVSSPNPNGNGVALHEKWTAEVTPLVPSLGALSVASAVVNVFAENTHGAGAVVTYPAGVGPASGSRMVAASAGESWARQVHVANGRRGIAVYSEGGGDFAMEVAGVFVGSPRESVAARPTNPFPPRLSFPGTLAIPDIGLTTTVREDVSQVDLDPSHLVDSRYPNQPGNVAIFGHRTSHGREFRNLDRLRVGSLVYLAVGGETYVYSTSSVEVLAPTDTLIYDRRSNDQTLTLIACHPPGSVKFRIVVVARLIEVRAG